MAADSAVPAHLDAARRALRERGARRREPARTWKNDTHTHTSSFPPSHHKLSSQSADDAARATREKSRDLFFSHSSKRVFLANERNELSRHWETTRERERVCVSRRVREREGVCIKSESLAGESRRRAAQPSAPAAKSATRHHLRPNERESILETLSLEKERVSSKVLERECRQSVRFVIPACGEPFLELTGSRHTPAARSSSLDTRHSRPAPAPRPTLSTNSTRTAPNNSARKTPAARIRKDRGSKTRPHSVAGNAPYDCVAARLLSELGLFGCALHKSLLNDAKRHEARRDLRERERERTLYDIRACRRDISGSVRTRESIRRGDFRAAAARFPAHLLYCSHTTQRSGERRRVSPRAVQRVRARHATLPHDAPTRRDD